MSMIAKSGSIELKNHSVKIYDADGMPVSLKVFDIKITASVNDVVRATVSFFPSSVVVDGVEITGIPTCAACKKELDEPAIPLQPLR